MPHVDRKSKVFFLKKMEQNPDFYQSTPTSYYYKFQRYMLINADNGEAK
jgi:hypothetical protein